MDTNTAPVLSSGSGKVSTNISEWDTGDSLWLQADGRILVAGHTYIDYSIGDDFALLRYNKDGSLDKSFDTNGKVTTSFGSRDMGRSITVQTDGKILVAGLSGYSFALARYNTDGSLDTNFDTDGKLITSFGSDDHASSVALQADGKIVVAGSSGSNIAVARYNTDGSLDSSFDTDGKLTTTFGAVASGNSVALQKDGKIVVAGSADGEFFLARYNTDGSLDISFDTDGKMTTNFGSDGRGQSVVLQTDGKILVAGHADTGSRSYDFSLARYNTDGSLDASFDTDGKLTTDFGSDDRGQSVALQVDGKIVVTGSSGSNIAVARYNTDGSLDSSFDTDGKLTTQFGSATSGQSVAVQADGKVLIAGYGYGYNGSNAYDFALVRYTSNGDLDKTFSSSPSTLGSPGYTENYSPIVLDENVQVLDTELAAAESYNGAILTLSRHNGSSPQDLFSEKFGGTLTTLTPNSYFSVNSVTIGRVTANDAGTLTLTFNANATQSLVNSAMQQIAYANTSDAPPATVQIDWTFNDGNTGAQGTGGAMSVTGSTTVQITATNDSPILAVPLVDQTLTANAAFSYTVPASSFTDPDLETLTYSVVMADGTGVPPWLSFNAPTHTFSGTPGTGDIGSFDIRVIAKDSANASVSDVFRLDVVVANTAPSFTASDGKVVTTLGSTTLVGNGIIVQADGKILVGGYSWVTGISSFALVRYNADGTLDDSFSDDGVQTTTIGYSSQASSVTLQIDGKILVAGYSATSDTSTEFALARYNSDGSLDTSFSSDGEVTTDITTGGMGDFGNNIALQADGKILLVGTAGLYFALVRYNADGSLDTSFSVDGTLTADVTSASPQSVAVQTDGKILVATAGTLLRYKTDGSLDTSFSADGKVTTDIGTGSSIVFLNGNSMVIQPDGKILVAGTRYIANDDFALARYNSDGSLDTSFAVGGMVTTDFGVPSNTSADIARSVTLQADGKILVAGQSQTVSGIDFALVRYNVDGSLDTSFSTAGKVTTDFNSVWDEGHSVTVQPDGKILVAGSKVNGGSALARYNADGSLDSNFSPPEDTLNSSPSYLEGWPSPSYLDNWPYSPTLEQHVQILDAELAATGNYNGASLTLTRHGGSSTQDVFGAKFGGTLTALTASSYFAVDSVTIGRVTTNSAGTLTLTFNANATQLLVNKAMQQIAYANSSDAPTASVQIDWIFNDGNTGAQGTGGAMSVTGSTTVLITATNDYPILAVPLVDQTLTANTAFSYTVPASAFTDPDIETLTYSAVMADGTGMPPWVSFSAATRTFSGTPGTGDVGSFDIRVTAKDSANASISDVVRLTIAPPDTVPPAVTTSNPIAEATGFPVSGNVVVTFNEAIARGVGNIVLKDSTGAAVANYDATTSSNLTISGATLTINPTADLAYSSGYSVVIPAGSIKDLAGNSYAGTSSYNFYTSAASTTTSVNFDQTADANLGGIWVHFTVGSESQVWVYGLTYRVGNSQPRLLGQLSDFTYSSPAKLISEGEYVAVTDGNGRYVLIQVANAQSINHGGPVNGVVFSSFIEPTVTSFSPLDEQVGVAVNSNVVVTFNEPIVQGVGAIVLKTAAGATVATYDAATSTNLSISGSTLTINPTSDLSNGTGYKVEFAAGTIKDLAGNSYAGTTSYNFTTVVAPDTVAPTVTTFSPADEATSVAIASNIVVTFSEAVTKGSGNIVIKTAAGATVATYAAATSTNLSISGATLTINPTADLGYSTSYKVEFAAGTIKDLAGNIYAGTTSYNFATVANGMPTATSATVSTIEDTAKTGTLTGTDPEGSALTFTKIVDPSHGTLTINATTGAYVYTPTSNYNGSDGFLFTVNDGTVDSVVAAVSITVSAVNDLPTGAVTISGTATQGQTLTASNTLADADGLGTISYHWYVFQDGGIGPDTVAIGTGSSYTLTQAEVGKAITVKASYTDALRTPESKTSAPTSTVATNQTSTGSTGNDSLTGRAGNDSIDGGAGTDAVVYSGSRSGFSLTKTSTGFTVVDSTGANGTDTLLNVERIKFSDGAIALDVGATQSAGQTAMLLGAVLPGRLVYDASKQPLLGAVIDLFDQGYSLQTLSGAVMRLPIWDVLTGKATPTNADIATYLLINVNGVAPDANTLANAVTSLNTETDFATQGNFLWHLAESSANQTHVGLVGLAATGLAYSV